MSKMPISFISRQIMAKRVFYIAEVCGVEVISKSNINDLCNCGDIYL